MIIAVASEKETVAGHFGHCENFNLFKVEGGKIAEKNSLPNPGHRPGFLPNYLYEQGVNVIIAGGMGGGAVEIFNEREIEVIVGVSGDAEEAVKAYIKGELETTGAVCHEHAHHGECGNH